MIPSYGIRQRRFAYSIGRGSSGAIFDLAVAYDGELNDPVRQGRDMIVLGLPTNLKFAEGRARIAACAV